MNYTTYCIGQDWLGNDITTQIEDDVRTYLTDKELNIIVEYRR